jgi:hypothetical protein
VLSSSLLYDPKFLQLMPTGLQLLATGPECHGFLQKPSTASSG